MQKRWIALALCMTLELFGAVNEVVPTDYITPEINSTNITLYGYHKTMDGPYSKQQKLTADSVKTNIFALRIGRTAMIGGYAVSPTLVAQYASSRAYGRFLPRAIGEKADGFGDIKLGVTTWLKSDKIDKEYFAITPIITFPTGQYDKKQILNIGENRYRFTINAGYIKRVANTENGELFVELSPEIAFYGDSKDKLERELKQKPTFALTEYIRFKPREYYSIFFGAQQNYGGETLLNKTPQNDAPDNQKLMIGGAARLFGSQVMLRYDRDVSIKNGFRASDGVLLRIQKAF